MTRRSSGSSGWLADPEVPVAAISPIAAAGPIFTGGPSAQARISGAQLRAAVHPIRWREMNRRQEGPRCHRCRDSPELRIERDRDDHGGGEEGRRRAILGRPQAGPSPSSSASG